MQNSRVFDRRLSVVVISKYDPKPAKKSFNITCDTQGVKLEIPFEKLLIQENVNLCRAG